MTSVSVTHEMNEYGVIACGCNGESVPVRGTSTCGNSGCRELRERVHASKRPPWTTAWPLPFTPGQRYAVHAYAALRRAICPGGGGHEPYGISAEYCDACIATAIAAAYEAGRSGER